MNRIPVDANEVNLNIEKRTVHLTNLQKLFWPQLELAKGDLLRYYLAIAETLLPHVRDRAMVMKRYPNGAGQPFFFMKRTPTPRPSWLNVCSIAHKSGSVIDFPVVQDLASLLWVINLGCIDLNPWYGRCDAVDLPDFLHFDLDPVPGADFSRVAEVAILVHQALDALRMPNFAKTTGSRGMHIYVPIVRGPKQKEVWSFAKSFALSMEKLYPTLVTAEYRIAKRPRGRVLVDYNQNAWGRTLAGVYSVRPTPTAAVSAPVTWQEVQRGIAIEDFRIQNMPARIAKKGDLWAPLLAAKGRFDLKDLIHA